jgi:hypothetical protein
MIARTPSRRFAGLAVAGAFAFCIGAGAVHAQTATPQTAATTPGRGAENDGAPREMVVNALTKSRESLQALNQYLTGNGASPQQVTRRATELIQALGRQRGVAKADDLLLAIDRVTALTSRSLAKSEIIQLAVDQDFRPAKGTMALDFGPPDGTVHPGFERVVPGDARITGSKINGLRRPAESGLLSDGVSGIERIKVKVAKGSYRIVLMTQNLGDQRLSGDPFGRQIRINGVPVLIASSQPAKWRAEGMLTNRGAALVGDAGQRAGGFLSGAMGDVAKQIHARQQGGAIVIEVGADAEEIDLELIGFGEDSNSYVTGMLVEPLDQLSDLVLSPEARQTLMPLEVRLALEAQVVAAAAAVIEQVAPDAGLVPSATDIELPEPEFETADVVSES